MTVLAKYQRLEAEGLWKPDPEAQRRDVIVSIGKATLTLNSTSGPALTHWSLPAIRRINPGVLPALYAPAEETPETLEIADETMVDAIDQVLRAVNKRQRRPGRLRGTVLAALALAFIALSVFWAPGAIARYTASIVPPAARNLIGTTLMEDVRRVAGAPCAGSAGLRALATLQERLFPDGGRRFVVLPSTLAETQHLPGGIILIGHTLVEDYEQPEVLAGFILAEDLRRLSDDPLKHVLEDAGLTASLSLLTTGKLPEGALRPSAERIVASRPAPLADKGAFFEQLSERGVAPAAYLRVLEMTEDSVPGSRGVADDWTSSPPILSDSDWIALQSICED